MSISGQLAYHGLKVEQVPKEEIVTRSHRLPILNSDGSFEDLIWLTNPNFCRS